LLTWCIAWLLYLSTSTPAVGCPFCAFVNAKRQDKQEGALPNEGTPPKRPAEDRTLTDWPMERGILKGMRRTEARYRQARASYGGKWVQKKRIDKLLGYDAAKEKPAIELCFEFRPEKEMENGLRSEIKNAEHQLLVLGHFRIGDEESACAVAQYDGTTYLWFGAKTIGLIPVSISFIPGATKDRDLLFVNWTPYSQDNRVTAYRRTSTPAREASAPDMKKEGRK
jgi:hypothetical protein